MVEYTVETLVHLYDSLNGQIEKILNDLRECNSAITSPNLSTDCRNRLNTEIKWLDERRIKLTLIRENVEELFSRILKAEVSE